MKVILISGKAQNGKDSVASIMKEKFSADCHSVLITHYADLVKYICEKFFGWDGVKDEDGRSLLQYIGTDVVRSYNPSFWVDFVLNILDMFGEKNWEYVIIPDCRFPNEITSVKNRGFDTTLIRVERGGFESGLTDEQKNHPSETALDNIKPDYYIHNDGSMDELRNTINTFVEEKIYGNS